MDRNFNERTPYIYIYPRVYLLNATPRDSPILSFCHCAVLRFSERRKFILYVYIANAISIGATVSHLYLAGKFQVDYALLFFNTALRVRQSNIYVNDYFQFFSNIPMSVSSNLRTRSLHSRRIGVYKNKASNSWKLA